MKKQKTKSNDVVQRDTLFISHATPDDNAFVTWLASRLSMAGYEVWCDQEKLFGGEDFWKDIDAAIRKKTIKFILVFSAHSFDEDGKLKESIAKEVALANIIKAKIKDEYFVVPMRIDNTPFTDFPIDFIRLNGIDCKANWASGLDALFKVLERDEVTRSAGLAKPSLLAWRNVHQHHARAISFEKEMLQSNWLSIESFPDDIHFFEVLRRMKPSEPRAIASACELPCFDHGRLLASFAGQEELQTLFGDNIPIKPRGTLKTQDFLLGRTENILGISPRDAKNKVTSLVRQAWNNTLSERGLRPYEMASGRFAWWFPKGIPEDGQLRFREFNGKSRRRAVSGVRGKKITLEENEVPRYYWHLGFTGKPFMTESPFLVLQPRIIISEDGETPLKNKTRLNSVRRSLTRLWFNDKWRSLVLGFSKWLANEGDSIILPVASNAEIRLGHKPITFDSPVGITSDPVSNDLSDEIAKAIAKEEEHLRLSDPAFNQRAEERVEE